MTNQDIEKQSGAFVISLDFELFWGMADVATIDSYGSHILGARTVIPKMLDLFDEYEIHATWATVGFLFFPDRQSLTQQTPQRTPKYTNQAFSNYEHISNIGQNEEEDRYHYASSLIQLIRSTKNQEIGTHTFSHYYCLEEGQTSADFEDDLRAAIEVAGQQGQEIKSIVFPRNQFNERYLEICQQMGITAYRGNEHSWPYDANTQADQSAPLRRIVRLLDSYLNLTSHHCYVLDSLPKERPYNIPSSRFLRPHSPKLALLEPLRLHRICAAMTHAAQNGLLYHLWWHPHNFGRHQAENLNFLRKILQHYKTLQHAHGFKSQTMSELADLLTS